MASNSSSIVISFSIAILLLLILLLLLSYNSKNKRDNKEHFNDPSSMLTNPTGVFTNAFNEYLNINKSQMKEKEEFESIASFDPYAKASMKNNINNGFQANDASGYNYGSLNGENENSKLTGIKEGFETPSSQDPTTCIKKEKLTSQDLLPKDAQNLIWSKINPSSQANIEDQNFLTAGYHIGVNTIGQSLRNANLQLRSEIPNPQVAVSPWLISTIEPDIRSTTLEIGSAPSY
jgi:hypothetical protein